jgi:hypothetical protein
MDWVAVVQQLDRDLLAIEMVRSGLSLQETEIRSIPLFQSYDRKWCTGRLQLT